MNWQDRDHDYPAALADALLGLFAIVAIAAAAVSLVALGLPLFFR